jgi:hypothetical protein
MAKPFKIGNAIDSVMDVANNIASKAKSVDYNGIYTDLKEVIKQTDEELANVAKGTLLKNITGDSRVPISRIQETAKNAGVNDVAFTRAVNNLSSAMKKQDLSEAHKIAREIDSQYQPGKKTFQDLVIEADIKMDRAKTTLENADPATVKRAWKNNFKKKIPDSVKKFTTDSNQESIANMHYNYIQGAKKYFATDDPEVNQKRLGVVAGGYVAATSGMRIINGGTPLTNEYGESDIAGIPFI